MYGISVIGRKEDIMGFSALGFEVFPASGADEASELLEKLARSSKYAVIFLCEDFAEPLSGVISKYKDDLIPAILPFPTPGADRGYGMKAVTDSVIRAIGSDII